MTTRWLYLAILFPLLPEALAAANDASAQTIVRAVQARYQHAKTLKATFFESYSEGGDSRVAESGTVYFSRPGRMRWDYQSPEPKLFLVDGQNAWYYVPADHTASRAKMKQSSDWRTPIAVLAGKADLDELCKQITRLDPAEGPEAKPLVTGDWLLRCEPRGGDSDLHDVLLEVDRQNFLARVVIHQAAGIQTEFRFGNWEENIPIDEVKFHFQPPAGVSVVDQDSLPNQLR